MTPLAFLAVLVAGYLVLLLAMVYAPRIRRRVRAWRQRRIDEEQAADQRTAWKRMDTGMWTGGRRG